MAFFNCFFRILLCTKINVSKKIGTKNKQTDNNTYRPFEIADYRSDIRCQLGGQRERCSDVMRLALPLGQPAADDVRDSPHTGTRTQDGWACALPLRELRRNKYKRIE